MKRLIIAAALAAVGCSRQDAPKPQASEPAPAVEAAPQSSQSLGTLPKALLDKSKAAAEKANAANAARERNLGQPASE